MTTMSSTGAAVNFQGEARVALRGAGLAWIVMGLLTLEAAWSMSQFAAIYAWWEFVRIKITVPVLMLVLVFGLALICAGIFAWRCARWAAYVGLGLGYLWLVSAIVFLLPVFPLAVLSIPLGHRALWLANPRRRRGDAATMGIGGGGSRRADWIAAAITCLAIGPVAGFLLGLVFGWLVTTFMVVARLESNFYGLTLIYGAVFGGQSMGAGSMLGGLIGGATLGWKRGRTVTVAFLGGAVAGLFPHLAMIAEMAMGGVPPFRRQPWPVVLSVILRLGAAGGMGGVLGAEIARALSRAMRSGPLLKIKIRTAVNVAKVPGCLHEDDRRIGLGPFCHEAEPCASDFPNGGGLWVARSSEGSSARSPAGFSASWCLHCRVADGPFSSN